MVSCVDKTLLVSPAMYERYKAWGYPSQLNYRSKCLTVWQTVLGVDVFIYGVYVQVSRKCPQSALQRASCAARQVRRRNPATSTPPYRL